MCIENATIRSEIKYETKDQHGISYGFGFFISLNIEFGNCIGGCNDSIDITPFWKCVNLRIFYRHDWIIQKKTISGLS